MKIIYLTDIHDALRDLRILLKSTQADLYLLSGDILYKAFYDEDKIYQFVCIQEELETLARERNPKIFPFDLASDILRFPENYNNSSELLEKAAEYRLLFNKAAKTMKEKYGLIEHLIQKYGNAECRLLPGNYDIDLRYTALSDRNLHQNRMKFRNLVIAGYGGAPIATSGIPEKLAVVFHERLVNGRLYSEPEEFFQEVEPDILVIHNPAYGFFDRIPTLGHIGSQGIRSYLDHYHPMLVVSGHVHEDYGVALKNGTVLMNTSNFGGVDSTTGFQTGGTFAEIYVEKKNITRIVLNRLIDEKIHPLLDIENNGTALRGKILPDAEKYSNLDLSAFVRDSSGAIIT